VISCRTIICEENRVGREALTDAVMTYLAQFIKTGNPNSSEFDLPEWESWSNETDGPKYILFDADLSEAQIEMSAEELTVSRIRATMQSEMSESQYSEVIESLESHWPTSLEILEEY